MKWLVIIALLSTTVAADEPCRRLRGRLSYYNGAPSTRIWIVGTNRILGVPSEDSELPPEVKKFLKGFDDEISANFTVCPLEKDRKGTMQMVKVKAADHVVRRERE
jgi:hypothetical protein